MDHYAIAFDDPGGLVGSIKGELVAAANPCDGDEVCGDNDAVAFEIGQDVAFEIDRDPNNR
jgi:hypothetical protein